jgi:predicted 3-demethylubiquinone-9 3-methyltransferase (glyoxalase superfamily)
MWEKQGDSYRVNFVPLHGDNARYTGAPWLYIPFSIQSNTSAASSSVATVTFSLPGNDLRRLDSQPSHLIVHRRIEVVISIQYEREEVMIMVTPHSQQNANEVSESIELHVFAKDQKTLDAFKANLTDEQETKMLEFFAQRHAHRYAQRLLRDNPCR